MRSLTKTLLAFVAMALAIAAFASSAMAATDGAVYDVEDDSHPSTLHFEGTTEFNTLGTGIHCDEVTMTVALNEAGTTGAVTSFEPTIETCEGFGFILGGCTIENSETILEESHVTVTPTDFDINGFMEEFWEHNAGCAAPTTRLEFEEEITVKPIGTSGETVGEEEPIAGIEFETEGRATNAFGTFAVFAEANLSLTPGEQRTYAVRAV